MSEETNSNQENDQMNMPEELASEIIRLRKRDKIYTWLFTGLVGVALVTGAYIYTSRNNSVNSGVLTPRVGQNGVVTQSYNAVNAYNSTASTLGNSTGAVGGGGAGGCCGGGSAGSGSTSKADLQKLEQEALAKFKAQFGDAQVTAKAQDFGCHIQIDIRDASNKILHSYAYRGGQMSLLQ